MILLVALFFGVPFSYLIVYGGSASLIAAYATVNAALGLGYFLSRFFSPSLFNYDGARLGSWNLRRIERILQISLAFMLVSTLLAAKSIANLGSDYRLLFFIEQELIFGFERYGFFLQILAEYFGLAVFSIVLVESRAKKWRYYLFAWMIMGTVITLGRWFILYGIVLLYLTANQGLATKNLSTRIYSLLLTIMALFGGSLLFICRGESCELDPTSIGQGAILGILNYFYIPLEMLPVYSGERQFGLNLFLGFIIYPIHVVGKITGLYRLPYEYDVWAIQVQDYVDLENIGLYNALVGQPLTSLVALGYAGIFVHYFLGGLLVGRSNQSTDRYSALQVMSIIILSVSFLMPTLSGPMFLICLIWYVILQGTCKRNRVKSAGSDIATK